MADPFLANIVWHSLIGAHAAFSVGTSTVRRYSRGFSPILGFANPKDPDLAALEAFTDVGEALYCGGWSGPVPSRWCLEEDSAAIQMVWEGGAVGTSSSAGPLPTLLGPEHVPQMLALADATELSPFGERTLELGEYYGIWEGSRLVAMAGERFAAGRLREISSVGTHPDFQGRGLARRLIELLIQRQCGEGLTPFLHVMIGNHRARGLYERMGFRSVQELPVRVVARA